jgi:mRNA-degrading endonuclease RelE of RelBE toxin-antitoxin system
VGRVLLATRAARDLRRLGPGLELDRIEAALRRLGDSEANLDIKPLTGSAPWLRLRVGDWRVLFRPADAAVLVARIIHRSELQQAVRTLE